MAQTKPFPWKCGACRSRSVVPTTVNYTTEIEHDGRAYSVTVADLEVLRCQQCGEMILDDAANRRISETFRNQLGILTPGQIRQNRESLRLTQKQLAGLMGIAEATLSRWETGSQVQQRALDKLLRLCFACDSARELLADEDRLAQLGTSAVSPSGKDVASCPGQQTSERSADLRRFSAVLDELPEEKERAAVEHFAGLLELMVEKQT
jgi:putative zinc finger/helix-turn-helix YgiT family protein